MEKINFTEAIYLNSLISNTKYLNELIRLKKQISKLHTLDYYYMHIDEILEFF